MAEPYKPLFNRTYLKILVWASAFAVLYLTTLGDPAPDYLTLERDENKAVSWVETGAAHTRADIMLPTGSAITSGEKHLQTLLSRALESQLNAYPFARGTEYAVTTQPDRITLSLQWPASADAPAWRALLDHLKRPLNPADWQPQLDKLKARTYLQSHKTDQRLLNAFFQRLNGGDLQDPLSRLNSHWQQTLQSARFMFSGHDAEDTAESLSTMLPPQPPVHLSARELLPDAAYIHLPANNEQRHYQLSGNSIPARSDTAFALNKLAAHSLQQLLASQAKALQFDYRQLWASLEDGGYRALLLSTEQPLDNLIQALSNRMNEDIALSSRQQLISQWNSRMLDKDQQLLALQQVAFYNLPADSLEQYPVQLSALDADQVVQLVRENLTSERQIRVRLSPAYQAPSNLTSE